MVNCVVIRVRCLVYSYNFFIEVLRGIDGDIYRFWGGYDEFVKISIIKWKIWYFLFLLGGVVFGVKYGSWNMFRGGVLLYVFILVKVG